MSPARTPQQSNPKPVRIEPPTPQPDNASQPDWKEPGLKPPAGPRAVPGLNPGRVLGMQAALGNRSVQRILAAQPARSPPHSAVQRWVGPEHAQLGDTTGMTVDLGNGVVLTWGQIIAIAGDEIGSLEQLEEMVKTGTGQGQLRAAIEAAGVPDANTASLPAPSSDQKEAQKDNFMALLLDNATHFQSGGKALDEWRKHHTEAVNRALRAGIMNPASSTTEINQAYLAEAFGQHFLTDMFSAGHIRTPRSEIADFYVNTFAPKVIGNLIANLRRRLEDGIYAQISAQSRAARVFETRARNKIRAGIDAELNTRMAALKGGMAELTVTFGKALGGVISGAIHDAEGKRGTWVNSADNPTPRLAKGDSGLNDPVNETNKQQAELAVKAGLDDVNHAYMIGQNEGTVKESVPTPSRLPEKAYFAFDSDLVIGSADAAVAQAAAYLAYNPETHLELIGHTDPLGSDTYNDDLGTRRAEAVKRAILAYNVDGSQVSTDTRGKTQLASTNPRRYNLNRRVEFYWTSRAPSAVPASGLNGGDPNQIAFERAQQALAADIGPPFLNVEIYLPKEVSGLNPPLPDWRWDSMSPSLEKDINTWVAEHFTPKFQADLLASDVPASITVEDYTIEPRPIVQGMFTEINANPMAFLRSLFR